MTDYEWLTEMGLCHRCRKEKTAPGKKFCFDCLDKTREYNRKRYDSQLAHEYQKRRRELYYQKKENGICIRCSKKATSGMYCYEHYLKEHRRSIKRANEKKEERHEKGLIPEKRRENGLCLWCGEKSSNGKNACERHVLLFSEAGKKSKENEKVVGELWKLKKSKNLNCT